MNPDNSSGWRVRTGIVAVFAVSAVLFYWFVIRTHPGRAEYFVHKLYPGCTEVNKLPLDGPEFRSWRTGAVRSGLAYCETQFGAAGIAWARFPTEAAAKTAVAGLAARGGYHQCYAQQDAVALSSDIRDNASEIRELCANLSGTLVTNP